MKRLIFYSIYQGSISTSGFNCQIESDSGDFFLSLTKNTTKKLSNLIKKNEEESIALSIGTVQPDKCVSIKNGSSFLRIVSKDICFSIKVDLVVDYAAIVDNFSNTIKKASEVTEKFNSQIWHSFFKKNKLSDSQMTVIEFYYKHTEPDQVNFQLLYEQNDNHTKASVQTSCIPSKMPFLDSLQFKLNLSIFDRTVALFSELPPKSLKVETTVSSQEKECEAILLQCKMNNELKERFFVLIPFK